MLTEVHSVDYISFLKKSNAFVSESPQDELVDGYMFATTFPIRQHMFGIKKTKYAIGAYFFDIATPLGEYTWHSAVGAASLAKTAAEMILQNDTHFIYCLCRPPGHHAGFDYGGGYCYINNASIVAKMLSRSARTAILDIDYHHGNGTQDIFWNDPQVFFTSVHCDPVVEYPFCTGFEEEKGGSLALGTNVNIPLPMGSGETEFLNATETLIKRILGFKTNYLVVSLGFDAHKEDPVGTFRLTNESYKRLGQIIRSIGIPTIFVQEGGYNIDIMPLTAEAFFNGVFY